MDKKIIIIGAGPAGLGAAWRLKELNCRNWKIYEKNNYVGGLSASFRDEKGFTWDLGGHVLFSQQAYFNRALDGILRNDYLELRRKAYIRIADRWVPYPFQNNIRYLAINKIVRCLWGLFLARFRKGSPANFKEWLLSSFGNGICDYFMFKYNFKVWNLPLEQISYAWIGQRISRPKIKGVLRDILFARDDVSWGPNNKFRFPLSGGTGEIFYRFAAHTQDKLLLGKEIVRIDLKNKKIILGDGEICEYDALINTMPLDEFIRRAELKHLIEAGNKLRHNSVLVVGIGLSGLSPSDKCWMYFPEERYPFYRVTYFSNYSSNNVPRGGHYSLLCEVAYLPLCLKADNTIIDSVIRGLAEAKIFSNQDKGHIVSVFVKEIKHAYPIPTLDRDKFLVPIQSYLRENDIYSCGRFGAWKYEAGNMDHSFMQGVEAVNQILGER
jgi:protoporphyrinogen oxidase